MTRNPPANLHSSDDANKRPKGILKNSSSFSNPAPAQPSPTEPVAVSISPNEAPSARFSDKEITLQNTLQNAGRRRSSSAARPGSTSRRHSSVANGQSEGDSSPRLKWDEANLYLTEQERTAKMKIDEPKTPYAPQYDPSADEDDLEMLDAEGGLLEAEGLKVDELDQNGAGHGRQQRVREDDIPGLKLGEPEKALYLNSGDNQDRIVRERSMSNNSNRSDKHVVVGTDGDADTGDSELLTSEEAKKKHQEFEDRRKRHYEMRDVKGLLGHPEELDDMIEDDDDDAGPAQPPAVPKIPDQFANGQR
ncbi:hypothetical protein FQN54_005315 [Arachnomyces sp. PD_36]|nr:hypothetical protein FQN54_005315 [Arachnomyces sp. PD_36]